MNIKKEQKQTTKRLHGVKPGSQVTWSYGRLDLGHWCIQVYYKTRMAHFLLSLQKNWHFQKMSWYYSGKYYNTHMLRNMAYYYMPFIRKETLKNKLVSKHVLFKVKLICVNMCSILPVIWMLYNVQRSCFKNTKYFMKISSTSLKPIKIN